jgi:hypothetical protein
VDNKQRYQGTKDMRVTQEEDTSQGGTLSSPNPQESGAKIAQNDTNRFMKSSRERGFVYFIICEDKYVKIGHSIDPADRFSGIQTDNPHKLFLVYFERGTVDDEKRYHDKFWKYHKRGEWFDLRGTLKGFIKRKSEQQQREFDRIA